jgi:PEP-CTERM motif
MTARLFVEFILETAAMACLGFPIRLRSAAGHLRLVIAASLLLILAPPARSDFIIVQSSYFPYVPGPDLRAETNVPYYASATSSLEVEWSEVVKTLDDGTVIRRDPTRADFANPDTLGALGRAESVKVVEQIGLTGATASAKAILLDPHGFGSVQTEAFAKSSDVPGGQRLRLGYRSRGVALGEATVFENVVDSNGDVIDAVVTKEATLAYSTADVWNFDELTILTFGRSPTGEPLEWEQIALNFSIHGQVSLRPNDNGRRQDEHTLPGTETFGQFGMGMNVYSRPATSEPPSLAPYHLTIGGFGLETTNAFRTLTSTVQESMRVLVDFRPDEPIELVMNAIFATIITPGSFNSDFSNTIMLDSITFEDGSTPEEHGFTVAFRSGLTSPNLLSDDPGVEPVPEPSTLGLLGLGSLGLCISRRRKRRRAKSSPDAHSAGR